MNYEEFVKKAKAVLPVRKVFDNPGGGTSTIKNVTDDYVYYIRGNSCMSVSFQDLYAAYTHFKGRSCSSRELKIFRPSVFDSTARPAGHSCNCTFLFLLLGSMNLCSSIHGAGKAGSPFCVDIP